MHRYEITFIIKIQEKAGYEYAGVDIYDPYTSSYTNNYELHQKQVQTP